MLTVVFRNTTLSLTHANWSVWKCHEMSKTPDIICLPNLVRGALVFSYSLFGFWISVWLNIFLFTLSTRYSVSPSVFICGFVSLLELSNVWKNVDTVGSSVFLRSNYRGRPGRKDGHHVLTYSLEIITDEMLSAFSHHICADSDFRLWLARLLSRKIQMVIRESIAHSLLRG